MFTPAESEMVKTSLFSIYYSALATGLRSEASRTILDVWCSNPLSFLTSTNADLFRCYFAYHLTMGGERSSTTRMRLAGKVCCFCGRHLDALLWQPPGERACDKCQAERTPTPKLRRIHMSFVLRGRWYCIFMEEDLCTLAAPGRTFTNVDNMVEMIRRGNGFRDLACRQAVEQAIAAGRGNIDLLLTPEQYAKLAKRT
jgi:hypothetical protein